MSNTLPRLGKGLEALIPKTALSSGRTLMNIPIKQIRPNPFQPRLQFNEEALKSLSDSIKVHGLNQPILIRRKDDGYELIAGERRFRACQLAGLDTVPAVIKDVSDQESLALALVENLEREDLNAIELALGYQRLLTEFGLMHQELATLFSRSRSAVSNTMRLLQLPEPIQQALRNGEITEGHGRALLSLESEADRLAYFEQIKSQTLSVREIEKQVAAKPKAGKPKPSKPAQIKSIEDTLLERFACPKVVVRGTEKSGKIELYYRSKDAFQALCDRLYNT